MARECPEERREADYRDRLRRGKSVVRRVPLSGRTGDVNPWLSLRESPLSAEQEKRDKVPRGTYQRIRNLGIAEGKRVPPVGLIVREIYERWGRPARIICDRFRLAELQDEIGPSGPFIEPRQTRWSEASEDIRALRKMTKDGPLAVERESRSILQASLSVAFIKNDDQGSFRLVKKSGNNCARDDAAAALLLAAGGWDRVSRKGASTPAFESSIVG